MTVVRATYRLQLRPGFGFDEAAALAGYLVDLGVSHVYVSPYLKAASGSTHGYDVVDHSRVNDELGGPEGHRRFCETLAVAGLGQVLDIVPNHMAVTPENQWWTDVLENGPASRYAAHFDVDWDPFERKLRNRVLMPVLSDHYGRVLEAGALVLVRDGGTFAVQYEDHRFPLAPPTYDTPLGLAAGTSGSDELAFLSGAFSALPPAWATDRALAIARHRDKEVLKRQLARALDADADAEKAVDSAVEAINADCDLLDALLERQNYRLAYWKTGGEELDYRRFFDITTLAGLRMEDDHVFADTHELVLGWLRDDVLDGLRIDHPDGLRDPEAYVERLREHAPDTWLILEKILEPDESLPESWPVDGTTGYDFLNLVGGLFVDPAGEASLTEAYGRLTGEPTAYSEVAHRSKHDVLDNVFAADLNRLTNLFVLVCERERRYRDFTRAELRAALAEALACLGVYRTYVRPGRAVRPIDARRLEETLSVARRRRGDLDPDVFSLLGKVLRGEIEGPGAGLCSGFQQLSGAVMAKGVEDTAFYRFLRLASLNEVGGDPGRFGVAVDDFHGAMRRAVELQPRSMLASSTHDTKRSEDVRARMALLSEVPAEFTAFAERWLSEHVPPDGNTGWLVLQTMIGAHPLPVERAVAFAEKATKEAKRHTSWTAPDERYDAAVRTWIEVLYDDDSFAAALAAFVEPLIEPGWVNSLASQLVKLTSPGVPDIYQGTELWDLSLVDPDNRRPVDFARRRQLVAELDGLSPADVWSRRADGLPKLWVTRRALQARPRGGYHPVPVRGAAAGHVVAFARDNTVTIVPRLPIGLARRGGWQDTAVELPDQSWTPVSALLAEFPVALVERT